MVLELLEGVDLQQRDRRRHPPRPAGDAAARAADARGAGPRARARDRPPRREAVERVPARSGSPAKIMDFGVARLSGLGTTTSGTVVGTPELHVARAGRGRRARRPQRPLLGRPHPLRARHRREGDPGRHGRRPAMYKIVHESPDLSLIPGGAGLAAAARRAGARPRPSARGPLPRRARDVRRSSRGPWSTSAARVGLDGTGRPGPARAAETRPPTSVKAAPERVTPTDRPRPAGVCRWTGSQQHAPPAATTRSRVIPAAVAAAVLLALAVGAGRSSSLDPPATGWAPMPSASPTTASPQRTKGTASAPCRHRRPQPPEQCRHHSGDGPDSRQRGPRRRAARRPAAPPARPRSTLPGRAATIPAEAAGLGPEARLAARARARAPASAGPRPWPRRGRCSTRRRRARGERRSRSRPRPSWSSRSACATRGPRCAQGDRERALDELRRGFLVRKNDSRLLELHREVVQQ